MIIITFSTKEAMQAKVFYTLPADNGHIRLSEYSSVHRAEFDGSSYPGQEIQVMVEACDPYGKCEESDTITGVI